MTCCFEHKKVDYKMIKDGLIKNEIQIKFVYLVFLSELIQKKLIKDVKSWLFSKLNNYFFLIYEAENTHTVHRFTYSHTHEFTVSASQPAQGRPEIGSASHTHSTVFSSTWTQYHAHKHTTSSERLGATMFQLQNL